MKILRHRAEPQPCTLAMAPHMTSSSLPQPSTVVCWSFRDPNRLVTSSSSRCRQTGDDGVAGMTRHRRWSVTTVAMLQPLKPKNNCKEIPVLLRSRHCSASISAMQLLVPRHHCHVISIHLRQHNLGPAVAANSTYDKKCGSNASRHQRRWSSYTSDVQKKQPKNPNHCTS